MTADNNNNGNSGATHFPTAAELGAISRQRRMEKFLQGFVMKSLMEAAQRGDNSIQVDPGILDDTTIKYLEDKGYVVVATYQAMYSGVTDATYQKNTGHKISFQI